MNPNNTPKEICDHLISGGVQYLRLTTENGEILCAKNGYNTPKRPDAVGEKKNQIIAFLTKIAQDGTYYIEGANSGGRNSVYTKIPYTVGKPKENLGGQPMSSAQNVLTYESALSMQNQIAQLTAKVEQLSNENDALAEDYQQSEEIIADLQATQMADNTQTPLAQVITILPAIVDKIFAQQAEKNALLREQIELQKQQQARQRPPQSNSFEYEQPSSLW